MKHGSTLFLKAIILLVGIVVLALCLVVLPKGIMTTHWGGYRPVLLGMYLPAIPFFMGLYQAFKLLRSIDHNQAFSVSSVKALTLIKQCAFAISAIYAIGLPYIYIVAEHDDAPGVMLIGLVFTFAPLIIAVFAAVMQHMFQKALALKSENDLTV